MNIKRKLLLVGPYPEPKGGVSVHIERLKHYLGEYYEIELIDDAATRKKGVFNTRSLNVIKYVQIIKRANIVHVHTGIFLFKVFHILVCFLLGKKIIFTYHSTPSQDRGLIFSMNKFLLNRCDAIVFVNEETKALFQLKKQQVYVQNAFLPPFEDGEFLPKDVIHWFDKQKDRIVFCANGWKLTYHNGEELYGLDMCVELVRRLQNDGIPCALIFTISKLNNSGILEKSLERIQQYGLDDFIFISTKSLPFIEIIKKSDIVLRPTNTDGDALTIREALFFGKKVIASDVVKRPKNTILFQTRDMEDLYNVAKSTLLNKDIQKNTNFESEEMLLGFYKNLYDNV